MSRREGHNQLAAAPKQLGHRQQAHEPRQPYVDRPGLDHEGAADQRSDATLTEVVQVGAGMSDDPVPHFRAETNQSDGDASHDERVRHGDPDPRQAAEETKYHQLPLCPWRVLVVVMTAWQLPASS